MSHKNVQVSVTSNLVDNSETTTEAYSGLEHIPNLEPLEKTRRGVCEVLPLSIPVVSRNSNGIDHGRVPGFLHLPQGYSSINHERVTTAAILLSGAGGGVVGPSSIYLSMGDKLASLRKGIPVLRLDYRYPARNKPCCQDVLSAMTYLTKTYQITRYVLVGWSFGSAPVFTVAAVEPSIVGCATIAGQTAETSGIRSLYPRPLLLLHGTGDRTLSQRCSESLYESYGSSGNRRLHLFEGDDHALTRNSLLAEEMLCGFIANCAGVPIGDREQDAIIKQQLVDETAKVELMKQGGDLRGDEKVQ